MLSSIAFFDSFIALPVQNLYDVQNEIQNELKLSVQCTLNFMHVFVLKTNRNPSQYHLYIRLFYSSFLFFFCRMELSVASSSKFKIYFNFPHPLKASANVSVLCSAQIRDSRRTDVLQLKS